jgi:hypothetical protein
VIGGGVGQVISQGSQFGLGTWLLKYSREYEKQADLLGAQIMARAGYDPRDLAHMFETIQKESKGSGPQWMSSHPDPGNRSQYLAAEAAQLQIARRPDDRGFMNTKQRFASLPPARSMADIGKPGSGGSNGEETTSVGTIGREVPRPSTQYKTARGGNLFQVNVPSNWTPVSSNNSVKFVPQNGYGQYQGQTVLTHGRRAGRGARLLARPPRRHRFAGAVVHARQPRHAAGRAAVRRANLESHRHHHTAAWSIGGGRR